MGFSLTLMRLRGGEPVDADRAGLARFLGERQLVVAPSTDSCHHFADASGEPLHLDGHWTDLHVAEQRDGSLTGGLWHATLGPEELAFVYDLCAAAGFLVFNGQAGENGAVFVVPAGTHELDDLGATADGYGVAFVVDVDDLRTALTGSFENFVSWRTRVLDSDHATDHRD